MIIVTGGAGFIGSRVVKRLNSIGIEDILVVDDLTDGHKFKNLVKAKIFDYMDKDDFLELVRDGFEEFSEYDSDEMYEENEFTRASQVSSVLSRAECIIHMGACSETTQWDGKYMMENNYRYSKQLFIFSQVLGIPLIYASSAAVYGGNEVFKEDFEYEAPLNVYGYSKWQFDQFVRGFQYQVSPVIGLRFFNVYGPGEAHKGSMASVAYHLNNQLKDKGEIRLFEGCDGFGDGEQRRDFIYVDDVVDVIIHFMNNPDNSGVYNVGTGRAQSFNDVASAVLKWHKKGTLSYIPFPEHLKGHYQSYTQADISRLRATGYKKEFMSVEEGVKAYLDEIEGVKNQSARIMNA